MASPWISMARGTPRPLRPWLYQVPLGISMTANVSLSAPAFQTRTGSAALVATTAFSPTPSGITIARPNAIAMTADAQLTAAAYKTRYVGLSGTTMRATSSLTATGLTTSYIPSVGKARGLSIHLLNINGTYRCRLPDYASLNISRESASPGSITMTYPEFGENFAALREFVDQEAHARIVIWVSGSAKYTLYGYFTEASVNNTDTNRMWTFGGQFSETDLGGAKLYPAVGIDDGSTTYTGVTPGAIILGAINAAKARGTLTDVITTSFDYYHDSNGVNWPNIIGQIRFNAGTSLTEMLDELREQGELEYTMHGEWDLRLYVPTSWGADRTLGESPVIFSVGRSITSAPRKYSGMTMASNILVVGADGLVTMQSNPDALAKLGRQVEAFVSAGTLTTQEGLESYARLKADSLDTASNEITFDLQFHDLAPFPIEDFDLGDFVWVDTPNAPNMEKLQVIQWTLSVDATNDITGSVSLNSLFYTQALNEKRRLDRLLNGSTQPGGTSVPPPVSADTTHPAKPTGVPTITSIAYFGGGGTTKFAQVTADIAPVTTNSDGSPITDLAGYQAQIRYADRTVIGYEGTPIVAQWFGQTEYPQSLPLVFDEIDTKTLVSVHIRAVDTTGNVSEWSDEGTHTTTDDDVAPWAPSAPTCEHFLRQIIVRWDGKAGSGGGFGDMRLVSPDFDHIEYHWSTVDDFTPVKSGPTQFERGYGEGAAVFDGATYGVEYFFKLIAIDSAGNASAASEQGSATGTRALLDDIADEMITAAKMANGQPLGPKISSEQISTPHLTVANFSDNMLPNGGFEDVSLTQPGVPAQWTVYGSSGGTNTFTRDTTAANVRSGGASAKATLSAASGKIMIASRAIPTKPGDLWYFEINARSSRLLLDQGISVFTVVGITDPPGLGEFGVSGTMPLLTENWGLEPVGLNYAIPATVGGYQPKYVQFVVTCGNVPGDSAPVSIWLDECRARKVVGTAEIMDAIITRAKIGLLAVGDAQIETASIGKLTAGTMSAFMTVSGSIRTANSGSRVEFDGSGMRLYLDEEVVGSWNTFDGSMLMTGTFRTGLSGERINLLPDGTSRYYGPTGDDYASFTNDAGVLRMSSIEHTDGRRSYVDFNPQGFHPFYGTPTEARSAFDLGLTYGVISAPVCGIRVYGKFTPDDATEHRFHMIITDYAGYDIGDTILHYTQNLYRNDGVAILAPGVGVTGSGVHWDQGAIAMTLGDGSNFAHCDALDFRVLSTEIAKRDISTVQHQNNLTSLDVIDRVNAYQWRYTNTAGPRQVPIQHRLPDGTTETEIVTFGETRADDEEDMTQRLHYFPIAEHLIKVAPSLVHKNSEGQLMVGLRDTIGLLWDAVQKLSSKVKELDPKSPIIIEGEVDDDPS